MTFQDLIPGNWFDRFTEKIQLPLFWKTKKISEKPMTSNLLDIFGYDIYLLFRLVNKP